MISPIYALLVLAIPAAEPTSQALPLDLPALKVGPRVTVTVAEDDGKVTYSGVPLRAVLDTKEATTSMVEARGLVDAVMIVHAADGYRAAVSAAAVAMDPKGERYLLAFERNGKPLPDGQAPAKLIIPADPLRVRWVRMIDGVDLVRLPKPEKAKARREESR
jgi:hypothetical protein